MLVHEPEYTKKIIAEKLINIDTPKLEEKAIFDAANEEQFERAIMTFLRDNSFKTPSQPRFLAGQFFEFPPPEDALLPHSYLLAKEGLYEVKSDLKDLTKDLEVNRLCVVPFFIASKDLNSKVLLYRYVNSVWLKDVIYIKKLYTRNTYLDLMIYPEPGAKLKQIVDYTFKSITNAPFISVSDTALETLIEEIKECFYLNENRQYPVLVNISDVRKLCIEHDVSYVDLKKLLIRHDIIQEGNCLKRDNETKKPSRFLIFKKCIDL